jgi:hypothetical protein
VSDKHDLFFHPGGDGDYVPVSPKPYLVQAFKDVAEEVLVAPIQLHRLDAVATLAVDVYQLLVGEEVKSGESVTLAF